MATLALPVNDAGDIHAASLIYWSDPATLNFYFVTRKDSEKCQLLQDGRAQRAACLIGTRKSVPFYLQMRGLVRMADPKEYREHIAAYYAKRGNRNDDIDAPGSVLLKFIPDWIRCTQYRDGTVVRQLLEGQ